jgi:hypothetical protein
MNFNCSTHFTHELQLLDTLLLEVALDGSPDQRPSLS